MSMVGGTSDNDPMKLMRILSDPEKLSRHLDQLDKSRAAAQAVIDLVGPASEVIAIRKQITDAKTAAVDAVVVARKKGEGIVEQANKRAKEITALAHEEAVKMSNAAAIKEQQAESLREQAQTTLSATQQKRAELEATLEAVKSKRASLDHLESLVEAKQEELDRRIGQLETVRTALRSMLAVP